MIHALALATAAAFAATLAAAAHGHDWPAGACGLPPAPLVVEYAEASVAPAIRNTFAAVRPPLVLATSGAAVGSELRERGAHTIMWQMNIQRLIGNTTAPADPSMISAAADVLYERAVATTGCATPSVALNELQGSWIATPWSSTNAQYRANTLAFLRRLHERGAHPYLMVTTTPQPFTASPEAAAWWRDAAEVSDLVLQVHFDARRLYDKGPLTAGRVRRAKMRSVIAQFAALGIPPGRLGLLHGFQSGRGFGGREGLLLAHWLRVVKWEMLAARQVLGESVAAGAPIGSDWSWGWGDFPELSTVDPQKPITACVYLWARNPLLCDGPGRAAAAGVAFNASLTEGPILLPPNVECQVGAAAIRSDAVSRFAALRAGDAALGRTVALASLFQRVVEHGSVDAGEVAARRRRSCARGSAATSPLTTRRLPRRTRTSQSRATSSATSSDASR